MRTPRKTDQAQPAGLTVEKLHTLYSELLVRSYVQAARLDEAEAFNAKVSAKLKLDPPPKSTIGENWREAKDAAYVTGFSLSHIYNLAKRGKIASQKINSRTLIDITSVPTSGK